MKFFNNLSIKTKVSLTLIFFSCLPLIIIGKIFYVSIEERIQNDLGRRLQAMASTGAVELSAIDHKKILRSYLKRDKNITEKKYFKRIQNQLAKIKKANNLATDVYTIIRPKWDPDKMMFLAMSNEKTYIGNTLPLNTYVEKVFKTKKTGYSRIYKDKEGLWISAFSPILDARNKVVAILEIDYQANKEFNAAKLDIIKLIVYPLIVLIGVAWILGFFLGNKMTKPVRKLTDIANRVAKGELDITIETKSTDEIGQLNYQMGEMITEIKESRKNLEDYAKNLETKVEVRTQELNETNTLLSAILNSLDQALFIFTPQGQCLSTYSKACLKLLEGNPEGKYIWDYLRVEDKGYTVDWNENLFNEVIPFNDMAALGPKEFTHSEALAISLNYRPVRDEEKKIMYTVGIATDLTNEHLANIKAKSAQQESDRILKIAQDKFETLKFAKQTVRICTIVDSIISTNDLKNVSELKLSLHTLKGSLGFYKLDSLVSEIHHLEEKINETTNLANLKSDFLSIKENLDQFYIEIESIIGSIKSEEMIELPLKVVEDFSRGLKNKDDIHFFETIFLTRPLRDYFFKYTNRSKELALKLNKEVKDIEFNVNDIRVKNGKYEAAFGTFVHIFNNIVDHGIESCEERVACGKEAAGLIKFEGVLIENEKIRVSISDDGRGIDPNVIREKWSQANRESDVDLENDTEVLSLIFEESFSTSVDVSELSGRGVGLSATKAEIEALGGSISVKSVVGKGTTFTIII